MSDQKTDPRAADPRAVAVDTEALVHAAVQALSRVICPALPHGDKPAQAAQGQRPPHTGIGGAVQQWPAQQAHPGLDLSHIKSTLARTVEQHDALGEALKKEGIDPADPRTGLVRAVVAKRQSRAPLAAAQFEDDIKIAIEGARQLADIIASRAVPPKDAR